MREIPDTHVARSFRGLAIASFLCGVAALCIFKILSVDFGWHIKAGELIWATKSIPTRDVFSYLAEGRPWVDSHWLFQLMIYGVHAAAGMPGLCALRIALVGAAFGALLATYYRREYVPVSLLVCLLALFVSYQRFIMRPELVSLCFLALFFYGIENFRRHPRAFMFVLPLCQLIWTNMHGLAIIGVAFLGIHLAGDLLQRFVSRPQAPPTNTISDARELKSKSVMLGWVVLAYLANANGLAGILYPFKIYGELLSDAAAFPRLEELQSPFFVHTKFLLDPVAVYKLFVVVSALSWVGHWRRIRFSHVLLYAAFLYLSTLAARNMSLFAVVATPITIWNVNEMLDRSARSKNAIFQMRTAIAATTAAAMILVAATVWGEASSGNLYARLGWPRSFGIGLSDRFAGDVLDELTGLQGRFFNSPDLGGYLIWKLYPQKQVAADGRWEVYGDIYPRLRRAYVDPQVFAALADEYDIVAVVLSTRTSIARKMTNWMRKDPGWHLTRKTRNVLLFERVDQLDRSLRRRAHGPELRGAVSEAEPEAGRHFDALSRESDIDAKRRVPLQGETQAHSSARPDARAEHIRPVVSDRARVAKEREADTLHT